MSKDCIDLGNLIKGMVLMKEKEFQKNYLYLLKQYYALKNEQHTNPRSIWLTEVEKEVNENRSKKNMALWKFILLITDFPMEQWIRDALARNMNPAYMKDFEEMFRKDLQGKSKYFKPQDAETIIQLFLIFMEAINKKYQMMKRSLCPEATAGNKYDEGEYQLKF